MLKFYYGEVDKSSANAIFRGQNNIKGCFKKSVVIEKIKLEYDKLNDITICLKYDDIKGRLKFVMNNQKLVNYTGSMDMQKPGPNGDRLKIGIYNSVFKIPPSFKEGYVATYLTPQWGRGWNSKICGVH